MIWGPAAAGRYLIDHGFTDYSAEPPLQSAEAQARLQHLLSAHWRGVPVRTHLNRVFQSEPNTGEFSMAFRIKIAGAGFVVPNINREVALIYAGTSWQRPFELWRHLPGVSDKNPNGGQNARDTTWIPSTYLG